MNCSNASVWIADFYCDAGTDCTPVAFNTLQLQLDPIVLIPDVLKQGVLKNITLVTRPDLTANFFRTQSTL